MKNLSIKIVGPAGTGIKSSGVNLAKFFTRQGFYVFGYTEYPSLIRGGHNTYQLDISHSEIRASKQKADILIPLTKEALEKELKNIEKEGIVICDESLELNKLNQLNKLNIKKIQASLVKIAKENGSELMQNTVALGVLIKILDLKLEVLDNILKETFVEKAEVAEQNIQAAAAGWQWTKEVKVKVDGIPRLVPKGTRSGQVGNLYITGNQASAMGVIASKCQLYVAYPMTPATDILHVLEANQRKTGMMVHQPEDEIAAIHVALGGSFAGVRSACGTSGGGFALMNEGLSLAGMLELPLVVFEVQRPGPATGNPTWSEQGDLSYVINAGHGEFAKIVLTPGTPEQCFDLVQHAFNLADKYQTPVIILSDKHLGESGFTISKDVFDQVDQTVNNQQLTTNNNYKRYLNTKTGISPRTIPGVEGGEHVANSDEHNEMSFSDEDSQVRIAMQDKRMRKLQEIQKEIPLPKVYGSKNAETTLVCWGSTFGACLSAVEQNKNINMIHFEYVWPLPKNLAKFLCKFKNLVLVENNKTGQLGKLIRQETGIEIKNRILKYDSRPFWREEIILQLGKLK